ncbi:hypothetical protein JHK87_022682 [Glycine soja]|nr:hypothetical protein JHK87_022682 [Glycine soja]
MKGVIELVLYLCSQKAHVQQFLATEDALNKAAEARDMCVELMKRLHGGTDVSSCSLGIGSNSQNVGSVRQLEIKVSFMVGRISNHWQLIREIKNVGPGVLMDIVLAA